MFISTRLLIGEWQKWPLPSRRGHMFHLLIMKWQMSKRSYETGNILMTTLINYNLNINNCVPKTLLGENILRNKTSHNKNKLRCERHKVDVGIFSIIYLFCFCKIIFIYSLCLLILFIYSIPSWLINLELYTRYNLLSQSIQSWYTDIKL